MDPMQLDALADEVAEFLGLAPDAVSADYPTERLSLQARDVERLLALARSASD